MESKLFTVSASFRRAVLRSGICSGQCSHGQPCLCGRPVSTGSPCSTLRTDTEGAVEPGTGCSHSRPSCLTFQHFASFNLGLTISFQCVSFCFTHFYIGEVTLTLPTLLFNLLFFPGFFLSKTWIMPPYWVCVEIFIPVLENVSVVCLLVLFSSSSLP